MRAEVEKKEGTFDTSFKALRKVKSREMLRIAIREIAGVSPLERTTMELTHLAEVCLCDRQTLFCDGELAGDPVLLGLEVVEGDGVAIERLK